MSEGGEGREAGPAPSDAPGSRRRRLIFFTVSGLALVGTLLLFGDVLLPFLLAIVVAYVLAPIVGLLERIMPRWIAVLILYLALLGGIAAFAVVAAPRLAVEAEKLARAAPNVVRTVRDEWIPQIEETFRDQMALYGSPAALDKEPALGGPAPPPDPGHGPDGGAPSTTGGPMGGGLDGGVPAPVPSSIVITPTAAGGYEVTLPPSGIVVHATEQGDGYVIATEPPPRDERGFDLGGALSDALQSTTANTESSALVIIQAARAIVEAVVRGIFTFFIMLMISAYLLVTSDRIFGFLRSLVRPERRYSFDDLLRRIDKGLSGVVRGQLLIAFVNGVLSGIGFYLFDLSYWPILTLIATVLSIIPIFGAIISSVPAVLVGLQDGFTTALLVLAWIVGIHQLEANVLNPKIMGDAAKVHPALVIFALLAGEHAYGIVGALLAVPVLSIAQSLFLHFREQALGVPARGSLPPPEPAPTPDPDTS